MKKVFWGLFLILLAAFIILNQAYDLVGLSFFSIVAALVLIPMFFSNIFKLDFGGAMMALGFFTMVFKEYMLLGNVSNWTIFFAAVLSAIGLEMIFGRKRRTRVIKINKHKNHHDDIVEHGEESDVVFKVNMGSGVRYVDSPDFRSADLNVSLGAMKVYFDNSQIVGDSATVYLDGQLGSIELFFPKEWEVVNELDSSLANVELKRSCAGGVKTKKVYLKGNMHLGNLEVRCI
jgi:predicted membrane protein